MAISANLFSLLGVSPALGRDFLANEDQPGNQYKVLLSHKFWIRHFGGNASAIGKTLTLEGKSHLIVGVMPQGFSFPPPIALSVGNLGGDREVWVPQEINRANRDYHPLGVFARLRPDMTVEKAQSEITGIAARLSLAYPKADAGLSASVYPFLELVTRSARPALLTLLAGVGCVLLIACVNIANLLLARSTLRRKELAIRASLGANRGELVKQIFTENMLLVALGGVAGIVLAYWSLDPVRSLANIGVPRLGEVRIDWRLLTFAAGLSILTGLFIGWIPALTASRVDLNETLKDAGLTLTGARHNRLRNAFAVGEVGLAMILLIAAGLLVRSFDRILNVAPGFEPKNVLTADIRLRRAAYTNELKIAAFQAELLDRTASLPGVISVATVNSLPIAGFQGATLFRVEGRLGPQQLSESPVASQRVVSPGYFSTMGIPILRGRDFGQNDQRGATRVIIISKAIAERYFPGEDPIGKRMQLDDPQQPWWTIVGVAADVRQFGLTAETGLTFYIPYMQESWGVMSLVVRTRSNPQQLGTAIRQQVAAIDRDQPVSNISTLENIVTGSIRDRRFQLVVLGTFSAVALILALLGIYGVISYSVSQRTNEIAIRIALGAQPADVLKRVLGQGMALAAAGVAAGLIGALAVTRAMASLLFEIRPEDPATLAAVATVVLLTALAAIYLPAVRATRIDPITALRD
jgi:putative ABC transport system permease protein